jgi:hypothetical protein
MNMSVILRYKDIGKKSEISNYSFTIFKKKKLFFRFFSEIKHTTMTGKDLQVQFFERIIQLNGENKQKISAEISHLLNISGNVVYDRLNGKKLLNIEELYILSNHYKTSINDMISPTAAGYNLGSIQKQPESFDDYLNSILVDLEQLAKLKDCEILYIASETPFFYYLFHP